jgi:CRP/FNR family transcriptional regulator/CRP/FNR family cyclic AMP-dependent transcriptional regulator
LSIIASWEPAQSVCSSAAFTVIASGSSLGVAAIVVTLRPWRAPTFHRSSLDVAAGSGHDEHVAGGDDERVMQAMRQDGLFADLPEGSLREIVQSGLIRTYRSRSYVTMQGDPSTEVFMLLEGRLEVSTVSPEAKPQLQSVLEPVQLFGELGVLAGTPRTASVLCLEDSRIWTLGRDAFTALVEAQPSVAMDLLGAMARQVLSKESLAEDLVWLDLKGRLAKRLLDLAVEDPDGPPVVPSITQADLASMCGVTRESVSKTLATFERRGVVHREGRRYLLLDTEALRRFAEG